MIHRSFFNNSVCAARYSSWGMFPTPRRYWRTSSGKSGNPVSSAIFRASVDFPPPAFPKMATRRGVGDALTIGGRPIRHRGKPAERALVPEGDVADFTATRLQA